MASGSSSTADAGSVSSAAQRLLQEHSSHHVTLETVPDEEDLRHEAALRAEQAADASGPAPAAVPAASWAATPSAKAAGKQKAEPAPAAKIDTHSHELFPELVAPKKAAQNAVPVWSAKSGGAAANGTNGATGATGANAANGANGSPATPNGGSAPAVRTAGPPTLNIPGRNVSSVSLEEDQVLPRGALKRPIPDIIKDINRKSRANITMLPPTGGRRQFNATGPPEVAQQALRDLVQQIGAKVTVNVPIPQSVRPHIIGKQGSTIKSLQEKTGARIQLPKAEDVSAAPDDDDDATIDVTVEGNALSARAARDAILKIVSERSANTNSRLRGIPSEFYPFISDPRRGLLSSLENAGVQVRVPSLQPRSAQPPTVGAGGRPVYTPSPDNHIQLAGERNAVLNARAEIEKLAADLQGRLQVQQGSIPPGRQQFIIGQHGTPMEDFFNETGCVIILPEDAEDDNITIVGAPDQVEAGLERAIDLAMGMQCSNFDISRLHRQAPGSAAAHARNVTRYLRQRKEIERLEREYQSHINTPFTDEGALSWELYSRDGKNALRAQTEIKNIVASHPPSRMASISVDPFFHQFLRNDVRPRVQQDYGVYLVVPEASEASAPVLLVYEGPSDDASSPYTLPQTVPTPQEVAIFQKGVRDAQNHILELIGAQEDIQAASIEVPLKFHERLRRYIKKEQEARPANQPPVRVSSLGAVVTLRGPKSSVEDLLAKITAFVEQEKQDEKERGFTMSFDFPKAFANHLVGKGGSNIRELRDKFDVEIQVQDGQVELKGPKAKAEAAKAHINSIARHLADETTHILKIEPKFHRELIGAQGSTINRLQTRYKVVIFFPRVAKAARDDDSATDAASDAGNKPRRQQAPDEVIVRGPKKGADEAREEIMKLYLYLKENSFTATVEVQQKQVPYLIGQGGSAMEALRQQTGAKIDVPNSRGEPDSTVEIQLKGTKEQVTAAKKILEEKKAVLDDTISTTVEVEKKFHKALIGPGGSTIKELVVKAGGSDDRRELSRAIQFPNQDSSDSAIKVEGRRSFVEAITKLINEFVSERASQVTEVIDVPRDKHRSLIGRGGETRRQIESRFNVVVDIPRQGEERTDVKVTGSADNVQKAKEHIQSLVKEQHAATIQVPRRLHHTISNNGQFFRRLRNENQVTVDHAGQAVPPRPVASAANGSSSLPLITDNEDAADGAHSWRVVEVSSTEEGDIPWVLRGSPENVDKAKKALEKAIEQAGQNNATGYLVLPDPKLFRHVVGHAGKKIDSIRKQSGCRIFVPQGKSGQEAIEVIGSTDGVETARELILAAVKEGTQKREQ